MGTHRFVIQGTKYEVDVGAREGGRVAVRVNGTGYEVEVDGPAAPAAAGAAPLAPPPAAASAPPATPRPAGAAVGGAGNVQAPMAGLVLRVEVAAGDHVDAGQTLVVLEAMKMENAIGAPAAGTVQRVAVAPQQTVGQGDLLVELSLD